MRAELDSVMRSPASRRMFLKAAGVGGMGAVLAACKKQTSGATGPSGATGSSSRPPVADEPGDLRPYEWAGFEKKAIWKDYHALGYPDPSFTFYGNTEQALAKTAGGAVWDTAHPEASYVQDYLNLGAIQPWDTALISNFADLNPVLEQAGNLDGKQYEIVTDWGYSGVIINTDHVDPAINSYSYLFDDALAGHISWFDSPDLLIQAGMVLGVESDLFDMSADDLQQCKEYCIEKKKNLYNIWVDYTSLWDDLRNGNLWAAYAWPDAWVNTKDDVPTQYIRPKEGVLAWSEGLVLNANTENYYHAHDFVNAWASPEAGLWLINTYAYGHSNLKVDLTQVPDDVIQAFGLDDPVKYLGAPYSVLDRFRPNRNAYNRAWEEVRNA